MKRAEELPDYTPKFTPIEKHGGYLVKRDDLFCIAGVRGGKVRSCWRLAQGAQGLITAGGRQSPQANIVAQIARRLHIPCRIHTAQGALSPELIAARNSGAKIIQHVPGRNNQICFQARRDHRENCSMWTEIPFAMDCHEAVEENESQVANLPRKGIRRIVVPVGSGISFCGVVRGVEKFNFDVPVLGVIAGQNPTRRLDKYVPFWRMSAVELVRSPLAYHVHAQELYLGDLLVDPVYEAKALPFLRPGNLFWCIGIRQQMQDEVKKAEKGGNYRCW